MNTRDELSKIIAGAEIWWRQNGIDAAAEAVLKEGYRKLIRLSGDDTLEGYRREGVVLRSDGGNIYEFRGGWKMISGVSDSEYVNLPAVVLYDPQDAR